MVTREEVISEAYSEGFEDGRLDNPEADGTDFAHPAWWRGNEHAHLQFVDQVNKILDGELANESTSTMPWEALRQRLYDLRTLLGIAERVITWALPSDSLMRKQWDKVRADYAKRRRDAERS
jgi:hypothetical protein